VYLWSCPWTQQLLRNVIRDAAAVAGPHDKGTSCIFKACYRFYFPLPFYACFFLLYQKIQTYAFIMPVCVRLSLHSCSFYLLQIQNCPRHAGHSLWRSKLDPITVYVRFVVDKVAVGQVFLRVSQFFSVTIIPPVLLIHSSITCAIQTKQLASSLKKTSLKNILP
jgi:hypothetical protein